MTRYQIYKRNISDTLSNIQAKTSVTRYQKYKLNISDTLSKIQGIRVKNNIRVKRIKLTSKYGIMLLTLLVIYTHYCYYYYTASTECT